MKIVPKKCVHCGDIVMRAVSVKTPSCIDCKQNQKRARWKTKGRAEYLARLNKAA